MNAEPSLHDYWKTMLHYLEKDADAEHHVMQLFVGMLSIMTWGLIVNS